MLLPSMSTSGLPGNREEPYRAGMIPMIFIRALASSYFERQKYHIIVCSQDFFSTNNRCFQPLKECPELDSTRVNGAYTLRFPSIVVEAKLHGIRQVPLHRQIPGGIFSIVQTFEHVVGDGTVFIG